MNNQQYWAKREEEALKHYITDEKEYDKELQRIYSNMLDNCQKEINAFYGKYAAKEGITLAEAKKRVSKLDIEAYERKAKQYVKDKDFSARANEEMRLYNAAMKINRLEMLKANIGLEMIAGHDELEKFMGGILKGRTEEELKRQAGILGKTIKNNAQQANAIVNASFHNATFSDRIWMYQDLMKAELSKLLQSGLIQGKNPRALARDLKKQFDVSTFNAERLMRTELARVQTEAQKQSFIRNGFDKYIFIVNAGCCGHCEEVADKDIGYGKGVYLVEDMQPGLNAPPLHPHDRCSTAAYSDDAEYEAWLDYLDKGGSTEEWNKLPAAEKEKLKAKVLTNSAKSDKIPSNKYGFNDIQGEHTMEADIAATNPKYRSGREYQVNCQRCVSAYEARRRGFDVEALPAPKSGMDYLPYMRHQKGWANVYENGLNSLETLSGRTAAKVKDSIREKMTAFGDGARAIIRVRWSRGNSGHVFIAEQINGETRFVDPQSGNNNVGYYFDSGMIKPTETRLLRIDDKEFTDLIELCAKNRGETK